MCQGTKMDRIFLLRKNVIRNRNKRAWERKCTQGSPLQIDKGLKYKLVVSGNK